MPRTNWRMPEEHAIFGSSELSRRSFGVSQLSVLGSHSAYSKLMYDTGYPP